MVGLATSIAASCLHGLPAHKISGTLGPPKVYTPCSRRRKSTVGVTVLFSVHIEFLTYITQILQRGDA